jgi:hypothetical protein
MEKPIETDLFPVLKSLGIDSHALLGQGGESWVCALDNACVARINRPGSSRAQVDSRSELLAELGHSSGKVSFTIPSVLDTTEIKGFIITIERRLPGRPLIELLAETTGTKRTTLIHAYLEAAAQIGNLTIHRPWYGDLLSSDGIRTTTYHDYLRQRAAQNLKAAGPSFRNVNAVKLAAALPQPYEKSLVHLDAYPGNMLVEGDRISAVLDFGAPSLIGDRRLDPITAAIYLDPAMTPTTIETDLLVAKDWLSGRELAGHYTAVRNWIAAYWSFASDDVSLHNWCWNILVD